MEIDVDKVIDETINKVLKKIEDKQKEEEYFSYLKYLHKALFQMAEDAGLDSALEGFDFGIDPLGDDKVIVKPWNLFTGLILMGIPLEKIPEKTKEITDGIVMIEGIEFKIADYKMSYKSAYPVKMVTFEFKISV